MKRTVNRKKLRLQIISAAVIAAAALVFLSLYALLHRWELSRSETQVAQMLEEQQLQQSEEKRPQIFYKDHWYAQKENMETLLLLGLDQFQEDLAESSSYRNPQEADFILLLIVDHQAKSADILQINRDTMTEIDRLGLAGEKVGSEYAQLALAHTYGSGGRDSCLNTVEAVSKLLYHIPIDHYLSITMDAVALVNDAVGGVTLEVLDDLTAMDPLLVKGEVLTLQGEQALHYVRTRYGLEDSSNIHRMDRQKQYLQAFYEQAKRQTKTEEERSALLERLMELTPYMVTDYTLDQLAEHMEQAEQYSLHDIVSIVGESVKGEEFMEFYADDALLQEQIIDLLYEKLD